MKVKPLMSGHCRFPRSKKPKKSHHWCEDKNGAGTYVKVSDTYLACSCPCHLGEEYECGGCGRPIREAPLWPDPDNPDGPVYVHVDVTTGEAIGVECT